MFVHEILSDKLDLLCSTCLRRQYSLKFTFWNLFTTIHFNWNFSFKSFARVEKLEKIE